MIIIFIRLAGVLLFLLALFNILVPRHLGWLQEMRQVSLLTRQVFWVHLGFIVLILAMMGVLSMVWAEELLRPSPLARVLLGGLFLFWLVRFLCQWFVYSPEIWRGDKFRTRMHWLFFVLWGYLAAVYGWTFWLQIRA